MYKIEEIFSECRADCFRNDFFYFCLNVTLVDDDTQKKAGKYSFTFFINKIYFPVDHLVAIDGGQFLGVDVLYILRKFQAIIIFILRGLDILSKCLIVQHIAL